jgi:hypothetical protein
LLLLALLLLCSQCLRSQRSSAAGGSWGRSGGSSSGSSDPFDFDFGSYGRSSGKSGGSGAQKEEFYGFGDFFRDLDKELTDFEARSASCLVCLASAHGMHCLLARCTMRVAWRASLRSGGRGVMRLRPAMPCAALRHPALLCAALRCAALQSAALSSPLAS